MTIQDQNVETHPNGAITTGDKLIKLPASQTPTQPSNGKVVEKVTEDGENGVPPTADVVVPIDGGWGWVVVVASFICCLVVDGIVMSAGTFTLSLEKEFNASKSAVIKTFDRFIFLLLSLSNEFFIK